MPKKVKNLYGRLFDFEVMYSAWCRSARGKRYRGDVLSYESKLEENLFSLIDRLRTGRYEMSGYAEFWISEPKRRIVAKLRSFDDRVLQQALHSTLNPVYESVFIADSFACRKGKGTHAGADRAQQMIRKVRRESGHVYALKCDIAGYFANIDHEVMKGILRKKLGDKRMLDLLDQIVDSYGESKGLPLGNLTSQLLANVYLNELDYFAKHDLKAVNYIRYMDDFVFFHEDKAVLHGWWDSVELFLSVSLKLQLNRKTALFPVAASGGRPLDFLGYRILPNRRRLRRSAIRAMQKKLVVLHADYASGAIDFKAVKQGMASHIAHASNADSLGVLSDLLRKPFKREVLCC